MSPLVLVVFLSASAVAFPSEGIHNHMTDDELDFYFGTNDVKQMPEYEVVQITIGHPMKKRNGGNSSEAATGRSNNRRQLRNHSGINSFVCLPYFSKTEIH